MVAPLKVSGIRQSGRACVAHITSENRIVFSAFPSSIRDVALFGVLEKYQAPADHGHQAAWYEGAQAEATLYIPARCSGYRGGGKQCLLHPKTAWPDRSAGSTAALLDLCGCSCVSAWLGSSPMIMIDTLQRQPVYLFNAPRARAVRWYGPMYLHYARGAISLPYGFGRYWSSNRAG
jgi:hypothetical protein